MSLHQTLPEFVLGKKNDLAIDPSLILGISSSCKQISYQLKLGHFNGDMHKSEEENSSGDKITRLDITSNDIFIDYFKKNHAVAAILSEELNDPYFFDEALDSEFILTIDPLDGSSNLEINGPVSSIFSICKNPNIGKRSSTKELINSSKSPIVSGFCLYAHATSFIFAIDDGVYEFVLDERYGSFMCTREKIRLPQTGKDVAINFSNHLHWNKAVTKYVGDCFQGKDGPRERYFNTRWYASAAAELYRILITGGVFIYPACTNGKKNGVIRKVYEAWPLAYICEKAFGKAIDGPNNILDIHSEDLHERTPFAMGSLKEISILQKLHLEIDSI